MPTNTAQVFLFGFGLNFSALYMMLGDVFLAFQASGTFAHTELACGCKRCRAERWVPLW